MLWLIAWKLAKTLSTKLARWVAVTWIKIRFPNRFFFYFCDRIEIQALSVANNTAVGVMQRRETICFITVLTVSERVKAIHSFMEFHQAKPLINSIWESFFFLSRIVHRFNWIEEVMRWNLHVEQTISWSFMVFSDYGPALTISN